MRRAKRKDYRGFTLAEAMMASVVLSIAAAGAIVPFVSGQAVRAEGVRRTLASRLASDLMEKIVSTPFDQIISGYDGYAESQGQVKDAGGVVFTAGNYANFSRDAICEYVYMPQESGAADAIFIRVSVRVYFNGRQLAEVNRLVAG